MTIEGYKTDIVADGALEFLDQAKDDSFLLYVPFYAPHTPYNYQPEACRKPYNDSNFSCFPDLPPQPWANPGLKRHYGNRDSKHAYSALVIGVDHNVGRILRRLEELGLRDDTLVIFTADQGWNAGHHGVWGKGNGTWPFNMYEQSIGVPLIWNHPGKIRAGRTPNPMVSSCDFFPTILGYLGVDAPEDAKRVGRSYAPHRELALYDPTGVDRVPPIICSMACRLLLALLLFAGIVPAAELQAEGAIDTRVGLSRRWDVILHNRARVRATENHWFDVSLVPVFRYKAHRSVTIMGGSFFTWFDFPGSGWKNVYRPFFGPEMTLRHERFLVTSRTLAERFFTTGGADRNRYRQRFRLIGRGALTPYAGVEFFFDNDGFLTTRYSAGARKDLGKEHGLEFGYWYETRKLTEGGVRHMIVATFHFNFKGLAPDI